MVKECVIRNIIVTPYLIETIINRYLIDSTSRERVDPAAKYVAREKRDPAKEGERERKSVAGVGSLTRGGEVLAVRSPHSTDNVTFFNPRFTLFAPPSRSRGRPQTVIVRLLSLYRERFLSQLGSRRGQGRGILAAKTATKEAALRSGAKLEFAYRCQGAREFRAGVTLERRRRRRRRRGKKEEIGAETNEGRGKICPLSRVPWTSSPERRRWCKVSLYLLEYFAIRANFKTITISNNVPSC